MKKLILTLCLLFSATILANPIDDKCSTFVIWGAPQIQIEGDNQYLCKNGYAINLNYKTKVAYFVVEHIVPAAVSAKLVHRQNDFKEDVAVPVKYRVTLKDYKNAVDIDRGHMAPAGDFTSDKKLMSDSFFLSNMMPQNSGNNRGVWRVTEEHVRDWAKTSEIYVITGTIYEKNYKIIGNNVGVPTKLYKIIIQPVNNRVIAFLYPNEKLNIMDISKYVVPVSVIQEKTGITFFPKIPVNSKTLLTIPGNYATWN
jgi:endonuclease G